MPEFRYTAREITGKQTTGTLAAANEREALGMLTARNLFPMSISMAEQAKAHQANKRRRVPAQNSLRLLHTVVGPAASWRSPLAISRIARATDATCHTQAGLAGGARPSR